MNNLNGEILIQAESVEKHFLLEKRKIQVLDEVNMTVSRGEFTAVVGPSGAGKSTLLHILGSLEQPTGGVVKIQGKNLSKLTELQRNTLRNNEIGFIFQFHHLLPGFSALENVMMPKLISGQSASEAISPARELLTLLGLENRLNNKPAELSGGEQQRVAVARALINSPSLVLADEPSGNLDRVTGKKLEDDLVRFARERDAAVIVVTHNEEWAKKADRVITLVDGRIS
ncbi:ABC transporter ATP-binding protein [bacterium]|nr:ABC transporter ATP-binding protein [bacterium]